ncbi:unnamed protein product [Protopolystoma xenopodis]|uniref:Uncharacterized protein n=1 Tax=Protopolystoma xenopodis TaxID=117903 RepID=A0A3S5A2J0_9PLAT|nr:unnamed protein product [Protopolystoma xenopodis]
MTVVVAPQRRHWLGEVFSKCSDKSFPLIHLLERQSDETETFYSLLKHQGRWATSHGGPTNRDPENRSATVCERLAHDEKRCPTNCLELKWCLVEVCENCRRRVKLQAAGST